MGNHRDGHLLHGDPFYLRNRLLWGAFDDMSIFLTVIGGLLWFALVWLILRILTVTKGEEDEK